MKTHKLKTLIGKAKKGNQLAQTVLMNLYWEQIFYFIYSKIRNKTDAEDITIKTFTKVFAKLHLYNSDFEFGRWVKSIAYNTLIDYIRQKPELKISLDNEFSAFDIEAATPNPEQHIIIKQDNNRLMQAIENLPETYQDVIKLRYLEEKSYKVIANDLGLTISNVKIRILRGKKLLEEEFLRQ